MGDEFVAQSPPNSSNQSLCEGIARSKPGKMRSPNITIHREQEISFEYDIITGMMQQLACLAKQTPKINGLLDRIGYA
jgi:hypothetical protein